MNTWPLPIIFIITISLMFLSAECEQEKNAPKTAGDDTEFIFGTAYGFCAGNCVHLFKLSGGKIYPDLMDRGNPAEATFSDTPLSDAEYRLAVPVREKFPQGLYNEETTIGCPDCADQGGYFIRIEKEGEVFQWTLDTNEKSLPAYLQPYAKLVGEVVTALRE